jgi:hypothetical protein
MRMFAILQEANLDAFWDQASSTVSSNLRAGIRVEKTTEFGNAKLDTANGAFPFGKFSGNTYCCGPFGLVIGLRNIRQFCAMGDISALSVSSHKHSSGWSLWFGCICWCI